MGKLLEVLKLGHVEIHKGVSECLNVVSKVCGLYKSRFSPLNKKASLALGNLRTAWGG